MTHLIQKRWVVRLGEVLTFHVSENPDHEYDVVNTTEKQLSRQRQAVMKKPRLGPKHADRRRKSKRSRKRIHRRWKQHKVAVEKPVRQHKKCKEADQMAILLRLINILGLVLLLMSVSILSSHDNLKEIIDLARKLFILLP